MGSDVLMQGLALPPQSVAMLRNITTFHTLATAAVERTAGGGGEGQKVTYNVIKSRLADLLYKITSQKFEDPAEGEEAIKCAPMLPPWLSWNPAESL